MEKSVSSAATAKKSPGKTISKLSKNIFPTTQRLCKLQGLLFFYPINALPNLVFNVSHVNATDTINVMAKPTNGKAYEPTAVGN